MITFDVGPDNVCPVKMSNAYPILAFSGQVFNKTLIIWVMTYFVTKIICKYELTASETVFRSTVSSPIKL